MSGAGSAPLDPGGPLWLLAELTYACPLQCPYCSNPVAFAQRGRELDTETWLRVFREARALGAVQLGFSGGEPLLRQDLETLIEESRRLGYYTNLITSGVGMDAARVARFRKLGLDHIQISFQAGTRELNDRMAGTGSFEHKVAMARAVKAQGFPMVLNFVLYRDNIDAIGDVLDLAARLDADDVELANTQYYGWAFRNRARLLPTRQQIEDAEAVVEEFRARHGKRPKVIFVAPDYYEDRPKACVNGWGRTFLTVAPDGVALPCQAAYELPGLSFPNVQEHELAWIWRQSDAFQRFRGETWMKEPCRSCPERGRDFGGCRCQAYLLTGDPTNTDPVCNLSPHRDRVTQAIAEAEASAATGPLVPLLYRNPGNSRRVGCGDSGSKHSGEH